MLESSCVSSRRGRFHVIRSTSSCLLAGDCWDLRGGFDQASWRRSPPSHCGQVIGQSKHVECFFHHHHHFHFHLFSLWKLPTCNPFLFQLEVVTAGTQDTQDNQITEALAQGIGGTSMVATHVRKGRCWCGSWAPNPLNLCVDLVAKYGSEIGYQSPKWVILSF